MAKSKETKYIEARAAFRKNNTPATRKTFIDARKGMHGAAKVIPTSTPKKDLASKEPDTAGTTKKKTVKKKT